MPPQGSDQNLNEDPESLDKRAREAAGRGDTAGALELWTALLKVSPNHLAALSALGAQALRAGSALEARKWFNQATGAHPNDVSAWLNLALACRKLNDNEGELAAVVSALDLDPYQLRSLGAESPAPRAAARQKRRGGCLGRCFEDRPARRPTARKPSPRHRPRSRLHGGPLCGTRVVSAKFPSTRP